MIKKHFQYLVVPIVILALAAIGVGLARAGTSYVDPASGWAWGTNVGWLNFDPTHGGVTVYDDHLEGYVWGENIGWVRLGSYEGGGTHTYANDGPGTYGVNHDGAGNLSGYAWGTNVGWIDFNPTHSQVTIDQATGIFDGYAWGENIGWVHFNNPSGNPYQVAVVDVLKVAAGGVEIAGQSMTDGKTIYGKPTSIQVEFSKDVANPIGHSDPDDVTNPANYLLVQAGSNGVYDTVDCSLSPDDINIPVGPVSYQNGAGAGPFIATATVNNGTKLPLGEYKFFVCGSTSIVDQNNVALAGDGVTPGTDHVLTFSIAAEVLPDTGFPPGQITDLGTRPAGSEYLNLGEVWMEIPALGLKENIVGVFLEKEGWDVTWLGNSLGYLEGTAFPTWPGNTVITGHVWDAHDQPGPLHELKSLHFGDQIRIHAWGQTYTYQVQHKKLIGPEGFSYVTQHEELDWITLLTCEFYNPFSGEYIFRRAVRAVLVDVK